MNQDQAYSCLWIKTMHPNVCVPESAYSCLWIKTKHTHAYESKPSILMVVSQKTASSYYYHRHRDMDANTGEHATLLLIVTPAAESVVAQSTTYWYKTTSLAFWRHYSTICKESKQITQITMSCQSPAIRAVDDLVNINNAYQWVTRFERSRYFRS